MDAIKSPTRLHRLMKMGLVERPAIKAGKRMYYPESGLQRVQQQIAVARAGSIAARQWAAVERRRKQDICE